MQMRSIDFTKLGGAETSRRSKSHSPTETVERHFDGRLLFDAHYVKREDRFRGGLFFNGPIAIVQIIAPQGPNLDVGIEGGYALGDLFLVRFFPGIEGAVMESVTYLDTGILARGEWEGGPSSQGR